VSGVPKRSDIGIDEFAYSAAKAGTLLDHKFNPLTGRASVTLRGARWFDAHRRGRRPDPRVAAWASRIDGPEFQDLDSLRAKCRRLVWLEYLENGGDPDELTEPQLKKLANARRSALMRWYEKQP
jgi:hypothetical protein